MKLYFTLLLSLFSLFSNGQIPAFISDKIWHGLKVYPLGKKVKRIRVEFYEVKVDSIYLRKYWPVQEYVYRNGIIDSINFIDSNDNTIHMTYYYDALGRIAGQKRYGEDIWYPMIYYKYLDQDRISSEIAFNSDSTINSKTIIQYNKKFQPILKQEFAQDSILRSYWIYKYDSCDQLIEELYINTPSGPGVSAFGGPFDPWPNDTINYVRTYSSKCQPQVIRKFNNKKFMALSEISMSGDTLIRRTVEYRFDGHESKLMYSKEVGSMRIEKVTFLQGEEQPSYEYTYFSDELVKYISTSYGETKTYKVYRNEKVFDAKKNWIEHRTFENDILIAIITRKISYK